MESVSGKYEGCSKCFPHANILNRKISILIGITELKQVNQDNITASVKNVSALLIRWHCTFFHQKLLFPQPLNTMSTEHSFNQLKLKTVKALGGIFILTQMSGHLFYSGKGLQRLLGPLYGCLNSSFFSVLLVRTRRFSHIQAHTVNPLNKNIQYNRYLV